MRIFNWIGAIFGLYEVVPVNEAHVRVMFDRRDVFMSRKKRREQLIEYAKNDKEKAKTLDRDLKDADKIRSSYWKIPFVTEVHKMPLTNIRIDVHDVKLNDKNMAKFLCDIACFVNISDPILAAERTDITIERRRYESSSRGLDILSRDFSAIMESIGRTVATKQTILQIYMDRQSLDEAVSKEVADVFPQWGITLVDLEIIDLKDAKDSKIIADIEKKEAATIDADARVRVAEEDRRARIKEANMQREAELVRAKAEEEWKCRHVDKDKAIKIAEQKQVQAEEDAKAKANESRVTAEKKLKVGLATVTRDEMKELADGQKLKYTLEAEGKANETKFIGDAEADIIRAKAVAKADGVEKLAEAQKKYDESATTIEWIKANERVGLQYADAYKQGLTGANITIVGNTLDPKRIIDGGLLGKVNLGAEEGAALQTFIASLGEENLEHLKAMLKTGGKNDIKGKSVQ